MIRPEVLDYYRRGGERVRLETGAANRLEYLRTWDLLTRVLPPAPARIIDVGGATGVYARPLADAGYRVRLVDPVPEHVAAAAGIAGVTAVLGDARELPAEDRDADAVLLLGPLYHLPDRADRLRVWREAARVARPGAPVVAATISRFASLFDGFVKGFAADARFRRMVERTLADGLHRNPDDQAQWFTTAYFHHPTEIPGEVTEAGLALERIVSVESPLWMSGPHLDEILADPEHTARMLDALRRVEDEPSLLGASSHLLTVARPGPVPPPANPT
ncbi:methyltransferase domain-containing protein [Micromonospora sp. NPDC049559]|uniref:class I SAM-dependent methyltransferase n=1 Tax=Micromonospora sp. NPDC049559 TaxID=3155923 RepID=UPI00341FE79B